VFELGSASALAKLVPKKNADPDAIAVLWLQDLTDDIEQLVKIPVLVGENLSNLRQNAINDQTAKHHNFKVVGWLETTLLLDSGLDENHELMREKLSQARRHALEAYDRVEGEAQIAEKNAHAGDDGVVDSKEQKAIKEAQRRQLVARGRGPAQIKAYRTGKWMKGEWWDVRWREWMAGVTLIRVFFWPVRRNQVSPHAKEHAQQGTDCSFRDNGLKVLLASGPSGFDK
jgi:hypothetical protein